jgi:hypothetical protein
MACGVAVPSLDAPDLSPSDAQVKATLREVFPELTEDEIDGYAARLDIDAVVALKLEVAGIRDVASALGAALDRLAADAVETRRKDLEPYNAGFPATLEPVGRAAFYDAAKGEARVELSGVFADRTAIELNPADITLSVDGAVQTATLDCAPDQAVDIVFLVDITGSMSSAIGAVRRSLSAFVSAIVARNVRGTLGVVTFQDTVGVNVGFQQPAPSGAVERSPFFEPVEISNAVGVGELQRFIARLEADSGADTPENLAGALDFARNNVIGLTSGGRPNAIGDGVEDPRDVSPWPALQNARQIFVAFTDAPFHADSRTADNSSLLSQFKPRPIADILRSLQTTGTTVHVSDPSWVDETLEPRGSASEVSVDGDFWAKQTGGVGEDRVRGYSLVDLELLVVAEDAGLLDIALDGIVASSCSAGFALPRLAAGASIDLELHRDGTSFSDTLTPVRF